MSGICKIKQIVHAIFVELQYVVESWLHTQISPVFSVTTELCIPACTVATQATARSTQSKPLISQINKIHFTCGLRSHHGLCKVVLLDAIPSTCSKPSDSDIYPSSTTDLNSRCTNSIAHRTAHTALRPAP